MIEEPLRPVCRKATLPLGRWKEKGDDMQNADSKGLSLKNLGNT